MKQMKLNFEGRKYWLGARHINAECSIDMIAAGVIRVGREESEFLYYEDSNGNPLSIFDLPRLFKVIGKEDIDITEDLFENRDVFNLCVHAGYNSNLVVKEDGKVVWEITKENGTTIDVNELPVMFKWLIDNQEFCW